MPGSVKQERFMQAIAHGWKPKKKNAPSQAVAQKWVGDIPKDSFPSLSKHLKGKR